MNYRERLTLFKTDKSRVVLNGMGTGSTKGTILDIQDDFIEYELLEVKTEEKSGKVKTTREVKYIKIDDIHDIGLGEIVTESKAGLGSFTEKKEKEAKDATAKTTIPAAK